MGCGGGGGAESRLAMVMAVLAYAKALATRLPFGAEGGFRAEVQVTQVKGAVPPKSGNFSWNTLVLS